ncbi:MAG: transglutaminase family protein [Bacteroidetes bacterium]|nr:transglutaminase family protein [Bacteroidota bacterium]
MLRPTEIEAMLFLLDDTDEGIVKAVESRFFAEGMEVLPSLEAYWQTNQDPLIAARIEEIIQAIQQNALHTDIAKWLDKGGTDLLEAAIMVARIQYPGLNTHLVHHFIEKVKADAWPALFNAQSPYDKVHALNHIFFDRQGMTGNNENYHAPDNSLINRVIETRRGNPITLCILYSVIAQRLGMPVFGVNLPQHFVLAWCDDSHIAGGVPLKTDGILQREWYGDVLFYLNPFSRGQIFVQKNIDDFLQVIKVEQDPVFYEPCANVEILKRMLRNLHYAYSEIRNVAGQNKVESFMRQLGMMGELDAGSDSSED